MSYTIRKEIRKRTILNITSKDISGLSQNLLNKKYVHALPTQLLIQAHNRVELQHFQNPKNKILQKVHTYLYLEMELREIEHYDTIPDFFTPSPINWPFSEAYDNEEIDKIFSKFIRNNYTLKKKHF